MHREFSRPDYTYRVTVYRVIDGDTLDVMVDVGFHTKMLKRLRLLDIDTEELRGGTTESKQKALLAKQRLEQLLYDVDAVFIQTEMDAEGKYGRVLAYLWVEKNGILTNVNHQLLLEGFQKTL